MEQTNTNMNKDRAEEENTVQYNSGRVQPKEENLSSERYRGKLDLEQTLVLGIRRPRVSSDCRGLFLQKVQGLQNSIPKHITSIDEKYVLRCLELIRIYSIKAAAWEIQNRDSYKMPSLAIECPLAAKTEIPIISGADWPIGTVSGSQSIINILNSPLLQQFNSLDCQADFRRKGLLNVTSSGDLDLIDHPQESNMSSHKLQKELAVLDHKYVHAPPHKRAVSMSSINSCLSDQSSSSSTIASSFQGMLQCTWKDGLPHYVFTIDDKREVYVADLSRVKSSDDKGLDYVYYFNLRKNGKKEYNIREVELESVGNMRVSTSITNCSDNNNLEIKETKFVLCVSHDSPTGDTQTSFHTPKKNNKRLARKVVDVFRSSHIHKHRSSSMFGGSDAILEDTPWEPSEEVHTSLDSSAESKYPPNQELAAIILKETNKIQKEGGIGGWGLKFLRKSGNNASPETSKCTQNTGECSTSMNVLIPAGLHGGPRTRVGGPSSLTERWISGGRCDCGGWDIGCPLTILSTKSSNPDSSFPADNFGECKSINLFVQGSKQDVPIMKMVNIHEGLYYINFQSTLSTLQSFAIAAAVIHSHSPALRPKVYRSLE